MSKLIIQESPNQNPEIELVLNKAQARIGKIPNMIRGMANSPVVADIYLSILEHLAKGKLTAQIRELIALTVAEENSCDYCSRAHAARGAKVGLNPDEMMKATHAYGLDEKTDLALKFAQNMIRNKASEMGADIFKLKNVGWTDAEISEIIAVTALNIFPNYFNKVNETSIDFPEFKKGGTYGL